MDLQTAASIGLGLIRHRGEIGSVLGNAVKLGKQFQKHLIQANPSGSGTDSLHALKMFSQLDSNHDGLLSKLEISEAVQRFEAAGLSQQGETGQLTRFGQNLLQHYEKVAALDGNASDVSYRDMGKLIRQDRQIATLSRQDWQAFNA